uniref:Odorant receptor n=1 Tax=Athetis dissimilis TaxID=1737331 RepID=A0A0S1TPH0_ATHDI|nr:odorant receptor 28 [Athetis dissimilis]
METSTYQHSKTTVFFYRLSFAVYILGLPNFWIEDLKLSKTFVKFYDKFTNINNLLIYFLILFEVASFFTQENLTDKQKSNLLLYGISHPMVCMFGVMMARLQEKVRRVMYTLTVELKRVHNDPEVERQMLASTYMYMFAVTFSCVMSMIMYIAEAVWEVVRYDVTFTTIVTAYPDVHDKSNLADVVRALCYIVWWIFLARIVGVYILVIPFTTCLSHQYKNLQSYFISLADIFERNDLSQTEKEDRYEAGFKVGIQLHSDTLRCTEQIQEVCLGVFSGQILFNMILLVVLMAQMANSERTLVNLCSAVFTSSAVLFTTGFYMWNAGDVTIEASHLATAMYLSGWYHNQGAASARIRKLVVISMSQAQRPVVLKGFGYIDLSYQMYLRIVKGSYSVFSVIY